jgi:hypothetical protein
MAHLSQQSVSNLVRRQTVAERRDLDGQAAAAVTPPSRKRKGGRPAVVTPRKYHCVRVAFRADPCGAVADVGAVLAKKGLQVSIRRAVASKALTWRQLCYVDQTWTASAAEVKWAIATVRSTARTR